jgi:hypothetical protein
MSKFSLRQAATSAHCTDQSASHPADVETGPWRTRPAALNPATRLKFSHPYVSEAFDEAYHYEVQLDQPWIRFFHLKTRSGPSAGPGSPPRPVQQKDSHGIIPGSCLDDPITRLPIDAATATAGIASAIDDLKADPDLLQLFVPLVSWKEQNRVVKARTIHALTSIYAPLQYCAGEYLATAAIQRFWRVYVGNEKRKPQKSVDAAGNTTIVYRVVGLSSQSPYEADCPAPTHCGRDHLQLHYQGSESHCCRCVCCCSL